MTSIAFLPAPFRKTPSMRMKMGQPVLTPENRVAIVCGYALKPEGLMAFVVDAVPTHQRKSRMVRADSLRPAPCGGPRLAIDNGNRRNPFAKIDENYAEVMQIAPDQAPPINGRQAQSWIIDDPAALPEPAQDEPRLAMATARRNSPGNAPAAIPAFLRGVWARDAQGRKLTPYDARTASLALAAFAIWPSQAARVFDAARLIEAARRGVIACSAADQSLLARIAARVAA